MYNMLCLDKHGQRLYENDKITYESNTDSYNTTVVKLLKPNTVAVFIDNDLCEISTSAISKL